MWAKILEWLAPKVLREIAKVIREAWRDYKLQVAYEEAIIENAQFDAQAADRAGQDATRERISNAEAAMGDDPSPDAVRKLLEARDPNAR